MMAYRLDDGPLQIWTYDRPCPDDLAQAIRDGATIVAWNAQFEHLAFDLLADRCGWPRPHEDAYLDTAAAAAAMSLPRALGDAAAALGLDVQKDKDGQRLIRKFSIPRKPKKDEPPGLYWNEPEDHVEDFKLFMKYCMNDVATEEAAAKRLVPLSDDEQRVWLLDQRINRRGIRIDTKSARAAIRLADKAKARLDREMLAATAGYVRKCSEPGKLIEWVQEQGVDLNSAAKAEIADLLELDDVPAHVRKALEIRQEAAKTSVSKLSAMMARASSDGRVRGTFMYHGASTGRWSNTGVNFANLPRPRKIYEKAIEDGLTTQALFGAIRHEDPDWLVMQFGDKLGRPLHLLSDAIRGFIWAAPDHDLLQADYSGIEGAVIAWLADEDWKVQALFDIKADPSIPDLYRQTAAQIMNTTTDVITKKHPLRQSVGKVSELALGFGGGVSAFYSMAKGYGIKLDELFGPVWETADEERRAKAVKRYEGSLARGKDRTTELSREAWVACELIKVGWRAANPAIAASWRHLEGAVRQAVQNPGEVFHAAKCAYKVAQGFLWCRLPSGRCLAYGSPRLKDQVWAKVLLPDGSWSDSEVVDKELAEKHERAGTMRIEGNTSPKVSALGVNSTTRKWERFGLYGGLCAENCTQAVARDLLVNGMWKAEQAGYPIIATVYDEIITEVPRGFGDVKEFERLICELPAWADGLPLTASGWRGKRYRKD
jgi:DNA polymerase